ncbi:aminoglycoside 6-adenylyltransferase [Mobilitalea sibirica]|uniref:Aminoglycoside 6-adenylyltransferase n=1 Tax=Mobilitalea sibirica TaxID=1462919 RepID=A0A8J7HAK3_9FIRM|nr:aminoglycoside 6-adenylyltransferase [Mobilitalea sibirica]MBH1940031.1 aminoglycoside 6-adenylyltransferase [Mobilitalea sibirica]
MRTEQQMMDLIMKKALEDDRIRAVTMEGSRANKNAVHDQYSDFDICYFVSDVREFTKDKGWIEYFGDILIVQYPTDWYSHPYDYNNHDNFTYLIQFTDGNRIDLTIIDITTITKEANNTEPRVILLNKDNFEELIPIDNEEVFFIKPPTQMEFYNTSNEFRWLSIYISKGLCRNEFYYAKYSYEVPIMEMFMKMLNWKIGIDHAFQVTTGSHYKYLKRFLNDNEMKRVQGIFPNGEYEDMWNKLFQMYDYFDELAAYVAMHFRYEHNKNETIHVRNFLTKRREQYNGYE